MLLEELQVVKTMDKKLHCVMKLYAAQNPAEQGRPVSVIDGVGRLDKEVNELSVKHPQLLDANN